MGQNVVLFGTLVHNEDLIGSTAYLITPGCAIERKQQLRTSSSHQALISRAIWSSIRMFLNRGRLLHHLTSLYRR